jgi:hypothetical protein
LAVLCLNNGKSFGYKGYISQPLTEKLCKQGTQLITSIRSNMKPRLMSLALSQNSHKNHKTWAQLKTRANLA